MNLSLPALCTELIVRAQSGSIHRKLFRRHKLPWILTVNTHMVFLKVGRVICNITLSCGSQLTSPDKPKSGHPGWPLGKRAQHQVCMCQQWVDRHLPLIMKSSPKTNTRSFSNMWIPYTNLQWIQQFHVHSLPQDPGLFCCTSLGGSISCRELYRCLRTLHTEFKRKDCLHALNTWVSNNSKCSHFSVGPG